MKTDLELQHDVFEELKWNPIVKEKEIGVAVKGGVVTLSGSVDSYPQKWAAERAAERISGVRAVADSLQVKVSDAFERTDTDIAHKVVDALAWDVTVPDEKIKTKVTNGWVTLDGSVEWQYQKDACTYAVRNLAGVRGVTNDVKVVPKRASAFDVTEQIKNALKRRAQVDADSIYVDVVGGQVTLKGTLHSWAEREDAENAAWSAPGVTAVVDQIAIR